MLPIYHIVDTSPYRGIHLVFSEIQTPRVCLFLLNSQLFKLFPSLHNPGPFSAKPKKLCQSLLSSLFSFSFLLPSFSSLFSCPLPCPASHSWEQIWSSHCCFSRWGHPTPSSASGAAADLPEIFTKYHPKHGLVVQASVPNQDVLLCPLRFSLIPLA